MLQLIFAGLVYDSDCENLIYRYPVTGMKSQSFRGLNEKSALAKVFQEFKTYVTVNGVTFGMLHLY